MVVLSAVGNASEQRDRLLAGATSPVDATYYLTGMAFAMVLFSALSGALQMTSEHRSRSIGLITIVAPKRTRVLGAKCLVAAGVGAAHGLFGVATAITTAKVALARYDIALPINGRIAGLGAGLVLLSSMAGVWGLCIGATVRGQVAALAGIVVWTTMVESALIHLFPDLGRWLPGGAQAAVVADPSLPERLARPGGAVLLLLWMALAAPPPFTCSAPETSERSEEFSMRILFLSGRWDAAGRFRRFAGFAPSAHHTDLAATAKAAGNDAVLVDAPGMHLADDVVHLVGQYAPDTVVVCGDSVPPELVAAIQTAFTVPVEVTEAGEESTSPAAGGNVELRFDSDGDIDDLRDALATAGAAGAEVTVPPF